MPLNLKDQQRRTATAEVLADVGTFATTLLVVFLDQFGTEGLEWTPQNMLLEIRDDFSVELPRCNFDRLMAAVVLATTDRFYRNETDFVQLCGILAGGLFDPGVVDPVDAGECAWGITEAIVLETMLFGRHDEDEPFSDAVRAYVGRAVDDEGLLSPPDVLRIGIRGGGDRTAQVQADFADDAETLGAVAKMQEDRSEEIKTMVRSGLSRLRAQLDSLRLASGDAGEFSTRMNSTFGKGAEDDA